LACPTSIFADLVGLGQFLAGSIHFSTISAERYKTQLVLSGNRLLFIYDVNEINDLCLSKNSWKWNVLEREFDIKQK
jgi:hypothetical protein